MKGSHPVDAHIGARVRARRTELGLSQQALGDKIGVSYQQLQKNEVGTNRVGASRLYLLAQALDVPVAYFFEGLSTSTPIDPAPDMPLTDREEARDLVRAFDKIKDKNTKAALYQFAKALARSND